MIREISNPKFSIGTLVFTRGVADKVEEDKTFAEFVTNSLSKHCSRDWGNLSDDDVKKNEFTLTRYLRLFSSYKQSTLPKIWIITEADRSVTTVLFPEEF